MSGFEENIYKAPESNITPEPENSSDDRGGEVNLERVDQGRCKVDLSDVLSEAWSLVKGTKFTFFLAMFLYMIVVVLYMMVLTFVLSRFDFSTATSPLTPGYWLMQAVSMGMGLIMIPLAVGLGMLGVQRARRLPISAAHIFKYYPYVLSLIALAFLNYVMVLLGFVLLIIPGIFLSVSLMFVFYLRVSGVSFWKSISYSIKGIKQSWFSMFLLLILLYFINVATIFTLGIGLIWSVPFSIIALGVFFRKVYIAD